MATRALNAKDKIWRINAAIASCLLALDKSAVENRCLPRLSRLALPVSKGLQVFSAAKNAAVAGFFKVALGKSVAEICFQHRATRPAAVVTLPYPDNTCYQAR
jgi:hypothetical protein